MSTRQTQVEKDFSIRLETVYDVNVLPEEHVATHRSLAANLSIYLPANLGQRQNPESDGANCEVWSATNYEGECSKQVSVIQQFKGPEPLGGSFYRSFYVLRNSRCKKRKNHRSQGGMDPERTGADGKEGEDEEKGQQAVAETETTVAPHGLQKPDKADKNNRSKGKERGDGRRAREAGRTTGREKSSPPG